MSDSVFCCDSLELLQQQPCESIDLIYVDPPFNTGRPKACNGSAHTYRDAWTGIDEYLEFLEPRLRPMHAVLKTSGTMYVHLDWCAVHYVKIVLDRLFGHENFLNEIIWHYRTGGVSRTRFARKHDNLLVYARQVGSHTFHVQRHGSYRTDGLKYDEDGRPFKSTTAGRLYFDPGGPMLSDVWDIPFLSTVSKERTGYPTQKPLALLRRIIAASSNPGDLVADFFCGSGTTLIAARQLGRACLGCDLNPDAIAITQRRLDCVIS